MARNVTLKDIAQRAGVSYQTVSKVLRGQMQVTVEVQERIFAAVKEMDYRPNAAARNLRTQASHMLGYSWQPNRHYYFNPVLEEFQQSIVETAKELGYHILLFPQHEGDDLLKNYQELVLTGRVDGFILSGMETEDRRVPELQQLNVPLVAFGRTKSTHPFPYVDVDGQAGIYQTVHHLLERGHCRIAILAWPEASRVGTERLSGYYQAMEENDLAIDPVWVVRGEGEYKYGYTATSRLLDLPANRRPTAIVTMMDLIAVGVVHAAQDRGLAVGKDLAVTGFDDVPVFQYFKPNLTTLRQPVWQVGRCAVQLLVNLLQGKPVDQQQILLAPELIIRASTAGS
ncbi:MAG TPA: LacI family DNA-binding transcriptional regulator [Aggregatilineaceae bacterium]|nr:LacI family DNA-binding transcriptional regulator [Aggregatilineaceae bacterium]